MCTTGSVARIQACSSDSIVAGNSITKTNIYTHNDMKQLSMFQPEPEPQPRYPWENLFDWMPQVGGLAQMHSVILPEQGYCYGNPVRINSINGDDVVCTVEHLQDPDWWKNGTVYHCTMQDLWPVPHVC